MYNRPYKIRILEWDTNGLSINQKETLSPVKERIII